MNLFLIYHFALMCIPNAPPCLLRIQSDFFVIIAFYHFVCINPKGSKKGFDRQWTGQILRTLTFKGYSWAYFFLRSRTQPRPSNASVAGSGTPVITIWSIEVYKLGFSVCALTNAWPTANSVAIRDYRHHTHFKYIHVSYTLLKPGFRASQGKPGKRWLYLYFSNRC